MKLSIKDYNQLKTIISAERIKQREIDLLAYASDAGFYEIKPIAIVFPTNEGEIQQLFKFCLLKKIPITIRAGATSLSGQTVGSGIILDISQHWRNVTAFENAVKVQPGVTGSMVNLQLKKYKSKIGPDPSSIHAAMMGGILSNNASGMCCGVAHNSYHTLSSLAFILTNGNIYNSSKSDDYIRFIKNEPKIVNAISEIQNHLINNHALTEKIRSKYKIKNTVGYSLNSFIDYVHPLDIFIHLLIGAEGTLAFISEAVLKTIPDKPFKATGLLLFETIANACNAIESLKSSGAEALELMDFASLESIKHLHGVPETVQMAKNGNAALLCEYQDMNEENLKRQVINSELLKFDGLISKPNYTFNYEEQLSIWKIRKGLFPSVGAVRARGTTVILEDIAFPLQNLSEAIEDLQLLFKKYNYDNAIIFGHAKDGNIHFVVTQSFDNEADTNRYKNFMNEVVELVVSKYHGSLKAEHGTGRNMAPFIETEWGTEAYEIMRKIKFAADPDNILNPGVIINEDKEAHIKNLKSLPAVEEEVDKCIECGFCETSCPSKDLTLTPRKRIVIRRSIAKLKKFQDRIVLNELLKDYKYDGLDTCAVDGMCAVNCPVDINTGDLVKRLRTENHSSIQNRISEVISKNLPLVERSIRSGLKLLDLLPNSVKNYFLNGHYTHPKKIAVTSLTDQTAFLYFPTCVSRIFNNQELHDSELAVLLAKKAGIHLHVIQNNVGLCCGQAFSSKGFEKAASIALSKTIEAIYAQSLHGKIPVVVDVSSCTVNLKHAGKLLTGEVLAKYNLIEFIDSVEFINDYLLPTIKIKEKLPQVTLHPVCSLQKLGLNKKFENIAKFCANEINIPSSTGCCGMAGDRGFLVPELTNSALSIQLGEIKQGQNAYCSSSVTCNLNLSKHTKQPYHSVFEMVYKASS